VGPTASQGHDSEDEHNQKSIKEYVIDGTAGPDEAAGNGDRLKEEVQDPRTARIAAAPCGSRVSWADTKDSETEYDDDKQGGADVFVGADGAPGVLQEPRCTVKVRGGLKVSHDILWMPYFAKQLGLYLSDLGAPNPNVVVTFNEATCTVHYEFEIPMVRAVACGLLEGPIADSEAADCEVVLDVRRWVEALSTAKEQYKELARHVVAFAALADREDPLPLQALQQHRPANVPQAVVSAAAAGSDGQSVRRPPRSQRKKTKK
jgi:hypothetical protein